MACVQPLADMHSNRNLVQNYDNLTERQNKTVTKDKAACAGE